MIQKCIICQANAKTDVCSWCFREFGIWVNKCDIQETLFLFQQYEYVTFVLWKEKVKAKLLWHSANRMWMMVIKTFRLRGFQFNITRYNREYRWVIKKWPEDWEWP